MPRADFYLIGKPRFRDEPLLLVCELAKKAHAASQPLLVLARDMEQAERLDDLLWSFEPDAFIPHEIAGTGFDDGGGDDEAETDVLIVPPDIDLPKRLDDAASTAAHRNSPGWPGSAPGVIGGSGWTRTIDPRLIKTVL